MSLQLEAEAAARHPAMTATGRDFKAWAKRIVWRKAMGDHDLLSIQIKFAEEALGIGTHREEAA